MLSVNNFYEEVLKHGAEKSAAFDRTIKLLGQKQYQEELQQALTRMKDMENEGPPCFPAIKVLADSEVESVTELRSCGFDDI